MDADFPYVYVNHDGIARELSAGEREDLLADFQPGDGGHHLKESYGTQTPTGVRSGFMRRSRLPADVAVKRVNPRYDEIEAVNRLGSPEETARRSRAIGYVVTQNPDGTRTHSPDPDVSAEKRWGLIRRDTLERQREREEWARHPGDLEG